MDSRVKDWLRPSDASVNLVNASKLRHSDTGRWFLESGHYKWFQSTPGASLWLRSIPGCGKTVLSSTIVENVEVRNRTTRTAIVYFFFSFSDESKQTLDYMLRSLISQLAGWDKSTYAHLLKLFGTSRNGHVQPQTIMLEETFNQMASEPQDVIVVLDALDESKDRHDLLRWITSSSSQTCRFILTSRSERDIEERFASWLSSSRTVTLESNLVGDDIEAYVRYTLEEEEHLSRWKSMHKEIANTLVDKAAGMFRWVYCQLQALSECLDKPAVRRMLQTLPEDLNETYDRILQSIPNSRRPNAIKLLQLLAFSKRPLRLGEFIDAVATEPDMNPPFDAENRISPPDAIIGYCANLIRITTAHKSDFADMLRGGDEVYYEYIMDDEDQKEKTIQLAHFSVREYLLLGPKGAPYYHCFEQRVAHAAISRIYLAYLWTAAEAEGAPGNMSTFPLIKHAARYWMDYAATSGEEEETAFAWTRKIFTNSSFLQYWARLYCGDDPFHLRSVGHALYHASLFALHRSVQYLLSMGADPNAQGGNYGNALQAALTTGDIQMVQILLDHGASVNANGGYHGSALHAAIWYGHIDTLRLLLKYGANIGALEWGRDSAATALQVAAYKGHTAIVKTVLMHGADVNARNIQTSVGWDGYADTTAHYIALEAASYQGHIEVVKILLDNNAEIDARGNYFQRIGSKTHTNYGDYSRDQGYRYGTPLQAASTMGHLDVVGLLVKSGADINAKSGLDGYALHAALSKAHTEVSVLLIDLGADIQARGGFHETTFHAAVHGGDFALVRLLMERGVDIHQSNSIGESPLTRACAIGSTQIVELLLDNGADIHAQGGSYGTALSAASAHGCLEIVQMLLDKGADVNMRAGLYDNALQSSCSNGHNGTNKEVLRLLLENGAEINAQGGRWHTALRAAATIGDVEVVDMLLREGADVTANCKDNCALCLAAHSGRTNVVQIFSKHNAIATIPGNHAHAVREAIRSGHKEIASILFKEGARVMEEDGPPYLKVGSSGDNTKDPRLTRAAFRDRFERVLIHV